MKDITIVLILISTLGAMFMLGFIVGLYVNGRKPKKRIKERYVEKLEKENEWLNMNLKMLMRHDD